MISSSSSFCDCGTYQPTYFLDEKYGLKNQNRWINGFYPDDRQPLIYYAKVEQSMTKKPWNMESRKAKPNYFSNALHWYDKSHGHPNKKVVPNAANTDMNSFAEWLDGKYEEFLRESDRGQVRMDAKDTATFVTAKKPRNATNKTKPERRWRSPWNRRRNTKNKEGDNYIKPDQSLEYILQPKELNQTTSENYQLNPPNFKNPSNTTTTTWEMRNSAKNSLKSRSVSKIQNTDIRQPVDFNTTPEGAERKYKNDTYVAERYSNPALKRQCSEEEVKVSENHKCLCPSETLDAASLLKTQEDPEVNDCRRFEDVSCQCFSEIIEPIRDINQLQHDNVKRYNNSPGGIDNTEKLNQYKSALPPGGNKALPTFEALNGVKPAKPRCPNSYTILVNERNQSCKLLLNDGAQTSDHSIDLKKDVVEKHPRVFKIYCDEKVSKACIR